MAGWLARYGRVALFAIMLLTGVLTVPPTVHADSLDSADYRMPQYFPETGFWMQGPFREYWETHGGLYLFGYPITGVFQSDGMWKQYFERAIFEWHPDEPDPYKVLLQRLGAIRTEGRENEPAFLPIDVEPDANCNFYPETGHRLCAGFRAYWEAHGGLPNLGYPISEEFDEQNAPPPAGDGQTYTVQYFERARFEYHPEYAGTEYEVLLGLLGTEYLQQHPVPSDAVARQDPSLPPLDPTTGMQYGPHAGYGFNVAWKGESEPNDFQVQTMDAVRGAGFNWVRVQVSWDSVEAAPGQFHFNALDRVVNTAQERGVHVLVSIVRAPTWATGDGTSGIPADPTPFRNTMEQLAKYFKGRVAAWEIWNEENLALETGGYVDLGRYVGLLREGYTGVKAGDPGAIVVFGGLTPTGVDLPSLAVNDLLYLQRIYAYNNGEVRAYFDVLGAHPGSNDNSPDQSWPDNPGTGGWDDDNSFYFRRIEDLRAVMVANGDAHKQIWLTEFGWSTANMAPGYEYGASITPEMQAQYLVRAFEIGKQEWPWIGPMFVWNLNFAVSVAPEDEKAPWGVLNPDWSPRPAYDALKNMPK